MVQINTDSSTSSIAEAIRAAATDLEGRVVNNSRLIGLAEAEKWVGQDVLMLISQRLNTIGEQMEVVAERIGVGGQIVREARRAYHMITNATESSLTGA